MSAKRRLLTYFINFWPPLFGAGIRVTQLSKDLRSVRVKLKKRFWNANYVGTQYGGSMFSMTDPFYMLMLIENLGPDYIVWDKATTIRYLKPGRTELTATFQLSEEDLEAIRATVAQQGKIEWERKVEILDAQGQVVAEVEKRISIKRRPKNVKFDEKDVAKNVKFDENRGNETSSITKTPGMEGKA